MANESTKARAKKGSLFSARKICYWNPHTVRSGAARPGLITSQAFLKYRKAFSVFMQVFSEWEMACNDESYGRSLQSEGILHTG